MARSAVDIANLALATFGSGPIQTFDDATPVGSAVALLYDFVVRGLFAEYPWAFARDVRPLAPLDVPLLTDGNNAAGWNRAYALPADLIGPPEKILANARYPDTPTAQFEIQNTTVYSNDLAIWAVGVFLVDETAWPDYFTTAAVKCLAAELYPRITGNGNLLQALSTAAWGTPEQNRLGGALGAARRRDAQANPSRKLPNNPLIDVRLSTVDVRSSGVTFP